MTIKCVNCRKVVTIPESILLSGKLQFICHLCNTIQEIKTVKVMNEKKKAGKLKIYYSQKHIATHDIFVGKNIVGRISEERKSDIEVPEEIDGHLSRQHFIIEVCETRNGNFEYLACYNNARNKTTIVIERNETELKAYEKIVLFNGTKIIAGKTTFILEIDSTPPQNPIEGRETQIAR